MLQITPAVVRHHGRRVEVVSNCILRVSHDPVSNRRVSVLVEGTLTNIMDLGGAMEVSSDGESWIATTTAYYDNPPLLTLQFPSDISGANRWRIADSGMWRFQNAGPLKPPFKGSVA